MADENIQLLMEQAERELIQLSETVAKLRRAFDTLSDENNRLRMTNAQLQALVVAPNATKPVATPTVSEGKSRLQTFYNEGIHICHPFFGSRRETGEECMFCQGVLDGLKLEQAKE